MLGCNHGANTTGKDEGNHPMWKDKSYLIFFSENRHKKLVKVTWLCVKLGQERELFVFVLFISSFGYLHSCIARNAKRAESLLNSQRGNTVFEKRTSKNKTFSQNVAPKVFNNTFP